MINENILKFYFEERTKVHISHTNGDFFNGELTQVDCIKQFVVIKDRKLGATPIMFEEIYKIEPFEEGGV